MIRLWLDDVREMPGYFNFHARTAAEAIEMLTTGTVTEISFDHDLGPESAGTGYQVAAWIEKQTATCGLVPPRWGVHSSNPVGAARIAQAMNTAWDWHGTHGRDNS